MSCKKSKFNEHPGIAYCKQGTRSIGQIIEALVLIVEPSLFTN